MPELALEGGAKAVTDLEIPRWPRCTEQSRENVLDALEAEAWCRNLADDSWVDRFEEEFADYHDAEHAVACANGTVAIELALRSLDVQPGDEVLIPPYTFIATASAVATLGAVPKFVDVDPETYNVDADAIRDAVTENTVGVVGVHIAGYPMDMDAILAVCEEEDLFLVEDAAHAQGTEWRGKKVGTIGDVGTFSFQATKALSGGEGGIVVTDDDVLAERAQLIANIGRQGGKVYKHYELASNWRMTEFQGALLCAQLEDLPEQNAHRNEMEAVLRECIADVPGVSCKPEDDRITGRGYCLFDLKLDLDEFGGATRAEVLEALSAEGVPAAPGYPRPMYEQPTFARNKVAAMVPDDANVPAYRSLYLPGVEEVCRTNVSFSHTVLLAEKPGIRNIGEAFRKVQAEMSDDAR